MLGLAGTAEAFSVVPGGTWSEKAIPSAEALGYFHSNGR